MHKVKYALTPGPGAGAATHKFCGISSIVTPSPTLKNRVAPFNVLNRGTVALTSHFQYFFIELSELRYFDTLNVSYCKGFLL